MLLRKCTRPSMGQEARKRFASETSAGSHRAEMWSYGCLLTACSSPHCSYCFAAQIRLIHRPGAHHGFDDVNSYFDWFDVQFGACVSLLSVPLQTAGNSSHRLNFCAQTHFLCFGRPNRHKCLPVGMGWIVNAHGGRSVDTDDHAISIQMGCVERHYWATPCTSRL